VFFDILSYIIGIIMFCIFKNFELNLIFTVRVYKLRLAEVNFLSCHIWNTAISKDVKISIEVVCFCNTVRKIDFLNLIKQKCYILRFKIFIVRHKKFPNLTFLLKDLSKIR